MGDYTSPRQNGPLHNGDSLIIGLDFGTTFSGIAYAFESAEKPEVHGIHHWPGLEGHDQPKIDTLISYDDHDRSKFEWGAKARDKKPIVGIKLLLDPDQPRPPFVPLGRGKEELSKLGLTAEQIASDYIGALYRHANTIIGDKIPKPYLERCSRKYVLTVPAIWSDKAKAATLKAARSAAIHPVSLVTEPEAAALYTLRDLQNRGLQVGDALVICDAGGGTVDLTSYEIAQLTPGLRLKALTPGNGGILGSLALNARFEKEVETLLGGGAALEQLKRKHGGKAWKTAADEFERLVKPKFRGGLDEEYDINFPRGNLPNDPANGLEDNCWTVSGRTLRAIFAPVITDILRLIGLQVTEARRKRQRGGGARAEAIKAILLVGGFGANEYLRRQVEAAHAEIQVIQPNGAWSAVVKGAVLYGLAGEAAVTSSVAKAHYGVKAEDEYEEHEDSGQRRWWDGADGIWRCMKMTWYIHIDDDLSRSERIRFPFHITLPANYTESDLRLGGSLCISEKPTAPGYPNDHVQEYVDYKADLRKVDRSLFRRVRGCDGQDYVKIDYDLTLIPMSGLFKLALEIKGREYGSVEAEYF